ncbi:hypothetical protein [Paenibacillus agilis]|uniref:Uncharacterized protein n=1 Tax=Paenibacillus agilis TaxID=3020863 RepID=A0A559IE80_9BACL|nr:hypothetical protein [Paenibacillus agilis]TVX85969.1 hypothetical protein FPZ44_23745 [Paenibacillus agilis]
MACSNCGKESTWTKLPDGGYKCNTDDCGNISYEAINSRIERIVAVVRGKAEDLRMTAAYNGERGDGGSGRIIEQIQYFEYGRQGVIPPDWEKTYGHFLDEEWKEYERLKRKFGGK